MREIVGDRHRQHQPLGLAVLRDQRHADAAVAWRPRGELRRATACRRPGPRRSRPRSTPNSASSSSFWPWPSRPPSPTISPRPTVSETPCSRFSQARSRDLEQRRRPRPRGLWRELAVDLAPDHQLDDLVGVLRALGEGLDVAAVAEHRAGIGQRLDLVHAVRDVEDAEPLRLAGRAACCRPARRRRRSAPRWPRRGSGASDRVPSALAISTICRRDSGRSLHAAAGVDVLAADARQELLGAPALRASVDQAEAARRVGDARCCPRP